MSPNIDYTLLAYTNDQSHWSKVCLKSFAIFYYRVTHNPKIYLSVDVRGLKLY